MNVAIKSGQLQKALEVYQEMLRKGCTPNVVTYNTLIDVYGKTGQWGEALRVIDTMNASNTRPVTRTYNTLMIACNTSGQWQEALNVYADMVRRGHAPNTTTYNALISAYSKAGRLEKVRFGGLHHVSYLPGLRFGSTVLVVAALAFQKHPDTSLAAAVTLLLSCRATLHSCGGLRRSSWRIRHPLLNHCDAF
jgi:pentatricopeptide repeat protein